MDKHFDPARIIQSGMGGFLNPPTHPAHHYSVEQGEAGKRWKPTGCMSLEAATNDTWIDPEVRRKAQELLETWQAPPIESPEIREWISQVLGYFRGCYQGLEKLGEASWHASNLLIDGDLDPMDHVDQHAGVHLIRQYYPSFTPTAGDFEQAYWGTKPTAA